MAALTPFFLFKDDPAFPGYRLAFLNGFSTVEYVRDVLVYWNGLYGANCEYVIVGRSQVIRGADHEPGAFIPLPNVTQEDVMLLLAQITPAAGYIPYSVPELPINIELETAMLRVAIVHKPNIKTLSSRQQQIVAPFRNQ
jgi:hypothetical protein